MFMGKWLKQDIQRPKQLQTGDLNWPDQDIDSATDSAFGEDVFRLGFWDLM
jgi:hypothetical protein